MTTETPCLSGCDSIRLKGMPKHVPNCPNAKPAEPKPCHICGQEQSKHMGAYRACPVPAEPPACKCGADDFNGRPGRVGKTAVPHAPNCPVRPAEPQGSEPPTGALLAGEMLVEKQRTIYALVAERDALQGKAAALELELQASDESRRSSTHNLTVAHEANAALKARVEELEGAIVDATQRANYSAWIVLDDMANAIRARKEASNGK